MNQTSNRSGNGNGARPTSSNVAATFDFESDLRRAVKHHQTGEFSAAENLYRSLIERSPDHFQAQHLLGILKHQQGRHVEAHRFITGALLIRPDVADAWSNHGAVLNALHRFDDAIASFDKALTLRPGFAVFLYNRGLARQGLNRHEEALADFEEAIRIRPEYAEALNSRGVTLAQLERPESALTSFEQAVAVEPGYLAAISNVALTLRRLQRLGEALTNFDRALDIDPGDPGVWKNRGATLQLLARSNEALSSYDQAVALRPDDAEAQLGRAMVLHSLERFEDALAGYERAVALDPADAGAFGNRGVLLCDLKRLDSAVASFDKAIELRPSAELFYNRGNALGELDRFTDALASFEQALALRPDYAEAYNNRGAILQKLERFDEALASLDKAIALKPEDAEAHNNRGTVLQKLKDPDNAIASYDRAIAFDPRRAEAYNNRANTLKELGRFSEALADYETAIALRPDFADAFHSYAAQLMELGRLGEAARAADRAIQLAPRKAAYYRTRGNIIRHTAEDPHVTAMEELIAGAGPLGIDDEIELRFALGKAYEDLGSYERAFAQLLAGNALKRRQITYDEEQVLGAMIRTQQAFAPEVIEARRNLGDPSDVPIFIVGMPRSGSTLVEQILSSHPRVRASGESKFFPDALREIQTRMAGSTSGPMPGPVAGEELRQLAELYLSKISNLSADAARVTDKLLGNFIFVGMIHLALPNAAIIHTVRDPLDTCISCFSKLFADGQNHTYELSELGRYYRQYRALMAHWHRVLPPGRILDVRYEDVVADLEGQTRRMLAYCGIEWNQRCLAFHQSKRPVQTASAVQVRRPINRNSMDRWRSYEAFLDPLISELDDVSLSPRAKALATKVMRTADR